MTDAVENLSGHHKRIAMGLMAGVFLFITLYWIVFHYFRCGSQRSFTISVMTERVVITEHWKDGTSVRLPPNCHLLRGDQHFDQSVLLYIPDGSTVALARKGESPTRIQVRGGNSPVPPSITLADGERIPLNPDDTLVIESSRTSPTVSAFVMPYRGSVNLGPEVREAVEYILLTGTVTAIEKPPLMDRVVIQTASLDPGDDLSWGSERPASASSISYPNMASGFVSVGEKGAIAVVSHIDSKKLTVNRYGADPYDIEPSALDSALKDRWLTDLLAPIITFAGGLLVIYDIGLKVWDGLLQRDTKTRKPAHR